MGVVSPEQEKENEREIWLSHLRAVSGQLKSKVSNKPSYLFLNIYFVIGTSTILAGTNH